MKGISRLPRIKTDETPDNRPTVSGIIVTGRSGKHIRNSKNSPQAYMISRLTLFLSANSETRRIFNTPVVAQLNVDRDQSIACCFTAAVAHIPDARTPTPRNKGQWRI